MVEFTSLYYNRLTSAKMHTQSHTYVCRLGGLYYTETWVSSEQGKQSNNFLKVC